MAIHECTKCGKDVELACADPDDCILGYAREARRRALRAKVRQLKIGLEGAAYLFAEMNSALKIVSLQSAHLASAFRDAFSGGGELEVLVVSKARTMGMSSFARVNADLIEGIEEAAEQVRKNDPRQSPALISFHPGLWRDLELLLPDKVHPEPVESNHAYFRRFEKRKRF